MEAKAKVASKIKSFIDVCYLFLSSSHGKFYRPLRQNKVRSAVSSATGAGRLHHNQEKFVKVPSPQQCCH